MRLLPITLSIALALASHLSMASKTHRHPSTNSAVDPQLASDVNAIIAFAKSADSAGAPANLAKIDCTTLPPLVYLVTGLSCTFKARILHKELQSIMDMFKPPSFHISYAHVHQGGKTYVYDEKDQDTTAVVLKRNKEFEKICKQDAQMKKCYAVRLDVMVPGGGYVKEIRFIPEPLVVKKSKK